MKRVAVKKNLKDKSKGKLIILILIFVFLSAVALIFFQLNKPKLSPTSPVPGQCNGNEFGRYYVAEGSFTGNPLCSSSASPAWNGEMSGSCGWVPTNPLSSIGGKDWWTGNSGIMPSFTSDGKWTFKTRCCKGGLCMFTVWEGKKLLGDTPAGDYVRTSGSSLNPIVHIKGCGDSVVQSEAPFNEQCDDSNSKNGDGCDACMCKPSVEVHIDGDLEATHMAERGGYVPTDAGINPFEDIKCIARTVSSCSSNLAARLVSIDKDTQAKTVIKDWSGMNYVNDNPDGSKNYEWKISGWREGWAEWLDDGKLNTVVADIAKDSMAVRCEVRVNGNDNAIVSGAFKSGLCVPIWGIGDAGTIGTVVMRGKSSRLTLGFLVTIAIINSRDGFSAIDPFKKYKNSFVHYADLKEYDEQSLLNSAGYLGVENWPKIPLMSQCQGNRLYAFWTTKGNFGLNAGATTKGGSTILFNFDHMFAPPMDMLSAIPRAMMHEVGHAFANLDDEYKRSDVPVTLSETNCKTDPDSFASYGEPNWHQCTDDSHWRPSVNSIMRSYPVGKFNVISCGYILSKIKPSQSLTDSWNECMNLDTIKPGMTVADGPPVNDVVLA